MKSIIKINNLLVIKSFKQKQRIVCELESNDLIAFKDCIPIVFCKNCGSSYIIKSGNKLFILSNKKEYHCRHCSTLGERNPFYGKKHTKKFKNELSKKRKGKWCIGKQNSMFGRTNYDVWLEKYGKEKADELQKISNEKNRISNSGENNGFYGKTHSKESIQKMVDGTRIYRENRTIEEVKLYKLKLSAASKKFRLENPEYYHQIKRNAAIKSIQSQLHYKKNSIEKKLEEIFVKSGIEFEYSFILNGKYQYDFRLTNKRVLIEADGDYWHGNPVFFSTILEPNKRILNDIQKGKMEMDRIKNEYAEKYGWKVIRFWENDIQNNPGKIVKELCDEIRISTDNNY